ncbi:MAG TPA: cytochrome P450 [Acidimicrobiales bacterium]|nr:cytochrome P450 [Acidimicrobiales bacterium]
MSLFPSTLDEIDFWDLEMFTEGDPHQAWSILRDQAPVYWHEREGGEPFWAVTRYEDGRAVQGDPIVFSSENPGIRLRSADMINAYAGGMGRSMIGTDPPAHQPRRRVISHNFTPRSVADWEAEVRRIAQQCLASAAELGEFDFVTEVAHKVPAAVALLLIGVPESDWAYMTELEHMQITSDDSEFQKGRSRAETARQAQIEIHTYFSQLVRERMKKPGDDLLSQLLAGTADGEPIPFEDVVAEAGLLLAGGLDTTRAAASAGGMLPLLEHPGQMRRLREDPSLLGPAVEEFVRWASPIVHDARTVTRDVEFRGHRFETGQRVAVWMPSCNRDASQFHDPFAFDSARSPNRHLGFAHGEHFCLGAHLARLTLRVEFDELLRTFTDIELVGQPERVRSNFVGGLKRLPVRAKAA